MKKQVKTTEDEEAYNNSIYGIEKKQFPYMLCVTNLLLHGLDVPKVYHANTLLHDVLDYTCLLYTSFAGVSWRECKKTNCARRSHGGCAFGQGFNSPRLHHNAQVRTIHIVRNVFAVTINNGSKQ